jgi:hypothetical protein
MDEKGVLRHRELHAAFVEDAGVFTFSGAWPAHLRKALSNHSPACVPFKPVPMLSRARIITYTDANNSAIRVIRGRSATPCEFMAKLCRTRIRTEVQVFIERFIALTGHKPEQ